MEVTGAKKGQAQNGAIGGWGVAIHGFRQQEVERGQRKVNVRLGQCGRAAARAGGALSKAR